MLITQHDIMLRDLNAICVKAERLPLMTDEEGGLGAAWRKIGRKNGHDPERGPVAIRLAMKAAESMLEDGNKHQKDAATIFLERINPPKPEAVEGEDEPMETTVNLQELLDMIHAFRVSKCYQKKGMDPSVEVIYKFHPSLQLFEEQLHLYLCQVELATTLKGPAPKGYLVREIQTWTDLAA